MKFYYKFFTIVCIIFILCILPSILLYFLGYNRNSDWNKQAVLTNCTIINDTIYSVTKKYLCFCIERSCQTCSRINYDGYINISHSINSQLYFKEFLVASDENYQSLNDSLQENYPPGKIIQCYYEKQNPSDIKLNLDNTKTFLTCSIIFLCAGIIIFFLWIVYEKIKNKCTNYPYLYLYDVIQI
ncbi:MAG: putative orfan [Satyrvirus sp.]|uniref:Putative orfan n=1 Tax=Satyrvirus sp. TaxID=2487771 RepID=A0A3G5AE49_9VIRU|nr:MAG: putative orfan [Satyrvirus sp.]